MSLLWQLDKLNSLTKYPSIPTYHTLGEKGIFRNDFEYVKYPNREIELTEKIDGTNVRILLTSEWFIIGSREEFLYYSEDLLHNPSLGIVENAVDCALQIKNMYTREDTLLVLYGELFGGNIGSNAKQYSSDKKYGFRVFDAWDMYITLAEQALDKNSREQLSNWRESNSQDWYSSQELNVSCEYWGIDRVPVLDSVAELPISFEEVASLLKSYLPHTNVNLDNSIGKSEGIVARTSDRKVISKLRFQDYERTLKQFKK